MMVNDRLSTTDDQNIKSVNTLTTPEELIEWLPLEQKTADKIKMFRAITNDIIYKNDNRILTIVWPCSIHNTKEALEYAEKLKELEIKYPNLFIVMRTYFEKPRTTVWWKWLINDPNLNWSFDIETWLKKARELLIEISEIWLPVSTEFLDTISPQYIWDLITWWAIWARTTESQIHRELASWLSATIWFKNWTNWDIQVAIDAIWSSSQAHHFMWATKSWQIAMIETKWNKNTHVILRWGKNWTNYDSQSISNTTEILEKAWIETWIMIDVSHANSNKDHKNQPIVIQDVANQIKKWNKDIVWVMIESNIQEWSQSFTPWIDNPNELKSGISITDKCISISTTDEVFKILNDAAEERKNLNK
jgi:3-deoxy-7-phosphoheptulonate synthase